MQIVCRALAYFKIRGRTHFVNHIVSLKLTAGCLQGLLERCAQCTAGVGALVTGASPRNTSVAAIPVSAEAHRIKLPGLCHHQAWRLCQAVCWVSTLPMYIGHMLQCHCEDAVSFVMVMTAVVAVIKLLVAVMLRWPMMQHCHCSDTLVCVLNALSYAKIYYEHFLCACACFCQ